jgi:F5/8 type C domain-containing protein
MKYSIKIICLLFCISVLSISVEAQTNVALLKRATQSSDYTTSSGQPGNAVDGNTDGSWYGNSVTHTSGNGQKNPWWSVDLGERSLASIKYKSGIVRIVVKYDQEQFRNMLRTGETITKGMESEMSEIAQKYMKYLNDKEIDALYTFIQTLHPESNLNALNE